MIQDLRAQRSSWPRQLKVAAAAGPGQDGESMPPVDPCVREAWVQGRSHGQVGFRGVVGTWPACKEPTWGVQGRSHGQVGFRGVVGTWPACKEPTWAG